MNNAIYLYRSFKKNTRDSEDGYEFFSVTTRLRQLALADPDRFKDDQVQDVLISALERQSDLDHPDRSLIQIQLLQILGWIESSRATETIIMTLEGSSIPHVKMAAIQALGGRLFAYLAIQWVL